MYVLTERAAIFFLLKRRELIIDPAGPAHRTRSSGVSVPLTPCCEAVCSSALPVSAGQVSRAAVVHHS